MSDTNETQADIIREMRDLGKLDEKCCDMIPRSLQGLGLRTYADRIEAATARERAITDAMLAVKDKSLPHPDPEHAPPLYPGNAAAMRAALERAIDAIDTMFVAYDEEHNSALAIGAKWNRCDFSGVVSVQEQCRAALAAPPRNCDRYATAKEAQAAFNATHTGPMSFGFYEVNFIRWLFAPAEGGAE